MRKFWVSWYSRGSFTWDGPWWISGSLLIGAVECHTICAAVCAIDGEHAEQLIINAHDAPCCPPEFRFVVEKDADWEPGADRFPRADWMRWPWPPPAAAV